MTEDANRTWAATVSKGPAVNVADQSILRTEVSICHILAGLSMLHGKAGKTYVLYQFL